MKEYKYIIIGGGIAGGSAIEGIREVDPDGSLVLIAHEPHRPYQRPPLSKKFLMGEAGLDEVYLKPADYYKKHDAEICDAVHVIKVDPAARTVTLEDDSELRYHKLLLATGGAPLRLRMPGNDLPGVFTLRTIEDSKQIRGATEPGKHALVLGGSFIGCEVASSLAQLGAQVTMVFPGDRLLEKIAPPELSNFLQALYAENGVRILPRTKAERLEGGHAVSRARLNNGQTLDVALVVMGVGISLNTELARNAGLEMDDGEGVVVDQNLRTSDAHIYAAGDIAAWPDPTFNRRLRVEHWDVAKNQGACAGRNMAGAREPYTTLPYFFSDLFDLSFEVWGNLDSWDQTVLRGSFDGEDGFAIFYFDKGRMVGVLTVGRPDAEREVMQALVKARPELGVIADRLCNDAEL